MAGDTVRKIRRAARLSISDWGYLLTAVKELLAARLRHGTQPMSKILGELKDKSSKPKPGVAASVDVRRLSWAIEATACYVPWRSDCLLKAMAADRWLRRCQLHPSFFLGVAKNEGGRFTAHAWLRLNGTVVTGGDGEEFVSLISPPLEQS